ncbi:MAG: hypothetical protein OXR62_10940 [Ahrensia sp.]|nr:hypothetical protein [Ahrensia sp.]
MSVATAVLSRNPAELPAELPRGSQLPEDHDPLADGILMAHQKRWLSDTSPLKVCEKGRRTGITYAEAIDATLIAARENGENYFYIGDTKDKGREFIDYVAHFAKVIQSQLASVEEFLFEDQQPDGTTKYIAAFRVRFASGFRVEALSSNPANIRGLQGVVCIDEAAFHRNVRKVIDAVNALLIWGGRVRVISTHNGTLNPFNELITEARAGQNIFKVHRYPFQEAIDNGLYERVCLIRGWTPTTEGKAQWEATIRKSYGTRTNQMGQELDAVPADAEGAVLTRAAIDRVATMQHPVLRWQKDDAFKGKSKEEREKVCADWISLYLEPCLAELDQKRSHVGGHDFARSGDRSAFVAFEEGQDLVLRQKLVVEMGNIPYDQQREVVWFIIRHLPRFSGAAFDATGNGEYLAEVTGQEFGETIHEVKLTNKWYSENGTAYSAGIEDQTILLVADADVVRDHQAAQYVNGIVRIPEGTSYKGGDGQNRHGDTFIAGMLAKFAARQQTLSYGYEPVGAPPATSTSRRAEEDRFERNLIPALRGRMW